MENDAVEIRLVRLSEDARLPAYASTGAAGADLFALAPDGISLEPGMRATVPTGLALEIPPGYEAQVRPRSGLAAKHGVTVLNAPGTIDSDYRGELKILLVNLGDQAFAIRDGDRIAQLVVAPVSRAHFVARAELGGTARGSGGFGSTGR